MRPWTPERQEFDVLARSTMKTIELLVEDPVRPETEIAHTIQNRDVNSLATERPISWISKASLVKDLQMPNDRYRATSQMRFNRDIEAIRQQRP